MTAITAPTLNKYTRFSIYTEVLTIAANLPCSSEYNEQPGAIHQVTFFDGKQANKPSYK